jgi:hypothetical protein
LPEPLQLQPKETFSVRLAFVGRSGFCYKVQIRAFWKIVGQGNGRTTLSDLYMVNFAKKSTTWQDEVGDAFRRGESVSVRLAVGWDTFDEYVETSESNIALRRSKIDWNSELEEFILLGDSEIIIPELHPKDRYIDSSAIDRQGILIRSQDIAFQYRHAFGSVSSVEEME